MPLTYSQAREKLKDMVGPERYRCMYYNLIEGVIGGSKYARQECRIYVAQGISTKTHSNWVDALAELDRILNPNRELINDSGAPDDDLNPSCDTAEVNPPTAG